MPYASSSALHFRSPIISGSQRRFGVSAARAIRLLGRTVPTTGALNPALELGHQ
jgi:hypothetical protein